MSVDLTGVSYLICAAAYLLALALLAMSRGQHRFRLLLISAAGATCAWAAMIVAAAFLPSWQSGLMIGATGFEALRSGVWIGVLAFVLIVPYGKRVDRAAVITAVASVSVAIAFLLGATIWTAATARQPAIALVRGIFIAQMLIAVAGLLLVENLFRNSGRDARWAIKYICFALGGMFLCDFLLYAEAALFARVDATLYAARGVIDATTAPLIVIAAARSRRWPIDLHVSRQLVFHSTTLLGAGIYLIAMAAAGYYIEIFNSTFGPLVQIAFFAVAALGLACLLTSGSVQARVKDFVNRNFFSYKYDYRQEWLRFIGLISDSLTEISIPERIVRGLANIVECTAGAIWVFREEDEAYHVAASWNMGEGALPSVASSESFVVRLAGQTVVEVDGGNPATADASADMVLPDWVSHHRRIWLILPLRHAAGLPAFAALGQPRVRRRLDWEDKELLSIASRQAASYIAEDNAARSLARARRFEEFNRQFAFVVHDIKNLAGQMTLILKNAERHGANPEFQRDVLATVNDSVGRMRQLLEQLKGGGARNAQTFDVGVLLRRLADFWRLQAEQVACELPDRPVMIAGESDQLASVLHHLVQNAIDAAGPNGRVSLALSEKAAALDQVPAADASSAAWAEIIVTDNGPGMDGAFIAEKLFRPLDSTKPSGLGIGAYQCREIIRRMDGRLLVDSVVGRGTRMIVRLPLASARLATSAPESSAPKDFVPCAATPPVPAAASSAAISAAISAPISAPISAQGRYRHG